MTERPDTLGDLSHTNPYTGAVFGDTQTYGRGRTVAADGGREAHEEPGGGAETDGEAQWESETETETLADVEHAGGDGNASQRTFDRGGGR
ncbi:hypothetical protein [Natronomonas sp.]|uniref:hypothetical protein n=1 Tax=Natronomonas sp. TaxID=2184060 RepID=UPI0026292859|nr:hypothetical protein [Natronomonas sp.]